MEENWFTQQQREDFSLGGFYVDDSSICATFAAKMQISCDSKGLADATKHWRGKKKKYFLLKLFVYKNCIPVAEAFCCCCDGEVMRLHKE